MTQPRSSIEPTLDDLREVLARGRASVELTEGEKIELRMLAQEGRPLYKIIKKTLDFNDQLKEIIATSPLDTEERVRSSRQLQLEREAGLRFIRWFIDQFDDRKPPQKELP